MPCATAATTFTEMNLTTNKFRSIPSRCFLFRIRKTGLLGLVIVAPAILEEGKSEDRKKDDLDAEVFSLLASTPTRVLQRKVSNNACRQDGGTKRTYASLIRVRLFAYRPMRAERSRVNIVRDIRLSAFRPNFP